VINEGSVGAWFWLAILLASNSRPTQIENDTGGSHGQVVVLRCGRIFDMGFLPPAHMWQWLCSCCARKIAVRRSSTVACDSGLKYLSTDLWLQNVDDQ